mmetsp:Transcript_801/g.1483  ORF Transcript_801/g.1483 Transcript_801/m.1483 type:complete len:257 (+) Transcript_801:1020-1790(+)
MVDGGLESEGRNTVEYEEALRAGLLEDPGCCCDELEEKDSKSGCDGVDGLCCVCVLQSDDFQRFLVARNYDVSAALDLCRKERKWRLKYLPVPISDGLKELVFSEKAVLGGCDNEQNASIFVVTRLHDKRHGEGGVLLNTQLAVLIIEKALLHSKTGKLSIVMDMNGFGWMQADLAMARRIVFLLSEAYPERLRRVFLLNAWLPFRSFWSIVSQFIDERSRQKVQFVESVTDHFSPESIPAHFGGAQRENNYALDP